MEAEYTSLLATGDYDNCDKLRHALLNTLAHTLLENPTSSHQADVHVRMWRLCFYKPIEHYRRLSKDRASATGKFALARLIQLIEEGMGIYLGLVRALVERHGAEVDLGGLFLSLGLPRPITEKKILTTNIANILSHCLVCAGDLSRYKSQADPVFLSHDRLTLPTALYQAAHACFPSSGHPCNMLAVVEGQLERPLACLYWYIRSMCCSEPSQMGRDNMRLLVKSGYCQKYSGIWDINPLVRLIQRQLFPADLLNGNKVEEVDYGNLTPKERLQVVCIVIGLDELNSFPITSWLPNESSYDTAESQLISLITKSVKDPNTSVHEGLPVLLTEMTGFLPLSGLLNHVAALPGLQARKLAELLQPAPLYAPSQTPLLESEAEEEIIHFRGFTMAM